MTRKTVHSRGRDVDVTCEAGTPFVAVGVLVEGGRLSHMFTADELREIADAMDAIAEADALSSEEGPCAGCQDADEQQATRPRPICPDCASGWYQAYREGGWGLVMCSTCKGTGYVRSTHRSSQALLSSSHERDDKGRSDAIDSVRDSA